MESYGIPEAAALLNLRPPAVRAMIEEGDLEARLIDGRWRVTRYALERARVKLHPGPRPVGDVDLPIREAAPAELDARLAAIERRLDRLEASRSDEEPGELRPALAHLFRPEPG